MRNVIAGDSKQLKGNVKQQWGKLADDKSLIDEKRDAPAGEIQEADGVSREETPVKRVESTNDDYRMHSSRPKVSE